jgi:hypothetical protein
MLKSRPSFLSRQFPTRDWVKPSMIVCGAPPHHALVRIGVDEASSEFDGSGVNLPRRKL